MNNLIAIAIGIGIQTLVISFGLIGITIALHDIETELRKIRTKKGKDND